MIRFEYVNDTGRVLAETIQRELGPYDGEALVFIGALGICVRKIKDVINDKYTDPAVVCVDSTGHYVIPVLSGHVGGANDLARQIAMITGGEAVITTQSDNNDLWGLDVIAKKYGWGMSKLPREDMNKAIATFVNRERTALILEYEDDGTKFMKSHCHENVDVFSDYADYQIHKRADYRLLIIVSPLYHGDTEEILTLQYYPRCLHLGVGCQKMAPVEIAEELLDDVRGRGYAPEAISTLGTIELKKDEPLIHRLTELLPWAQLNIHTAKELAVIPIPNPSEKVFEVTGCYGVAESAAKAGMKYGNNGQETLVIEKQKCKINIEDKIAHYTYAIAQDPTVMKKGHIEIVGAGPGDPELVSVRGRRFLENADLILYAGSLVPRELTMCAKPGAVVRSSADMNLEEQFRLMKDFYDRGMLVVRLHTGDPCIYGAIQEQMAFFDEYAMDYHITPGISSFLAAAAELRSQFTIPEKCQTIILTRGEGRTPMPDKEKLHLLASHQSTMCIFLSASLADQVQRELLEGGYPEDTPVAMCYKLTWKEQRIYRGQLKDLAKIMNDNKLTLTTMIVVGEAIDNRKGLSKLYDHNFTHLFRKGDN